MKRSGDGATSFGFGMVAAFVFLMTGDSITGWWTIGPPLRHAVMWGNIVGIFLIVTGTLCVRCGKPERRVL